MFQSEKDFFKIRVVTNKGEIICGIYKAIQVYKLGEVEEET